MKRELTMVKTVEEGPLNIPSNIKSTKTLTKVIRINFFKTIEMNQRLAAIREFIQEQLTLSKNSEAYGT